MATKKRVAVGPGLVSEAVDVYVASLEAVGAVEGRLVPVATLARHLARQFDAPATDADGKKQFPPYAALARELRACLAELAPKVDDEDDDLGALIARLSAPVVDPPQS